MLVNIFWRQHGIISSLWPKRLNFLEFWQPDSNIPTYTRDLESGVTGNSKLGYSKKGYSKKGGDYWYQ